MTLESTFIVLFVIAMAVAISVRRLRLPYTVGLVVAGLILGTIRLFPAPELSKSLLFAIFLPGLVFEAAFHIDFSELWRNRLTVTSLAIPGVIASMVLIAAGLVPLAHAFNFLPGFSWTQALVFGALISATDPVAVIAVFRKLEIPRRLSLLLESESLLNDGTGIVFFTLSLSIFAGSAVTPGALAVEFVKVVGAGAVIGVAVGIAVSLVLRHVDDPMIEVSLTTIAAYGSFAFADQLNYSGVIATVAAGLMCGNYGARTAMSPSTRVTAETFWDYVAFALNSVVFLLIGLEVPVRQLLGSWAPIVIAYLIVTLARALLIQVAWRLVGLTRERFPWSWSAVLTWGGLRGALPMVLALGLPGDFPLREQIVSTTFGVVILSILVHGLTMSPLLRLLGIVRREEDRAAYDLLRGELQSALAALEELERLERIHSLPPDTVQQLKAEYRQRIDAMRARMAEVKIDRGRFRVRDVRQARHHLLLVEKNRAVEAYQRGLVSSEVHDRLLAAIDSRILELQSLGDAEPAQEAAPPG